MPVFPRILLLAMLAVGAASAPAVAQVTPPPATPDASGQPRKPDAENGKVIAQRWCAECHVVTPDQKTARSDAPPFASIAARGSVTEQSLQRFLMNPHPKMPDMQIGRNEAADLAAWIERQKP
ncbi:c-type cytochrome [Alsobacter sp. R-9]